MPMHDAAAVAGQVRPFSLKDAPALIERLFPAQKISAEAQKERKAGAGQTLPALGSYWKGRKPLILVKACVLASLLPATDDPEADLAIFEKLMAIDDASFVRRGLVAKPREAYEVLARESRISDQDARHVFAVQVRVSVAGAKGKKIFAKQIEPFETGDIGAIDDDSQRTLIWHPDLGADEQTLWQIEYARCQDYLSRVSAAKRPEEVDQDELFNPIWGHVNSYLETSARSMPELVEQLGIMRFGHRPKVGDTFCGGGSIPFEAARIGCDVYASDLNPIACMLTWGALNIIGADEDTREEIEKAQREAAQAVAQEIAELGIEHDSEGNRAKAYLYCLETRCPQTGWMVPMSPTWVISTKQSTIARLIPNPAAKRFGIDIVTGVSKDELFAAKTGTVQGDDLVYKLDGEEFRTPIKSLRGDFRLPDGTTGNRLRQWEKSDFKPRPDDIFQERLYCIQWITRETLGKGRQQTFFASVTQEDLERESRVEAIVAENLAGWQKEGLVPDMRIEPGDKTDEPIRTRGWTHWHHLFSTRQLLLLKTMNMNLPNNEAAYLYIANELNFHSKLCGINPRTAGSGREMCLDRVFINQALNTLMNHGVRSSIYLAENSESLKHFPLSTRDEQIETNLASGVSTISDYWVTDPPYGDAVAYHEITEFFIAWLRKSSRGRFEDWVWDSRRLLAIKGDGQEFRKGMVEAYKAMADHMPDNGLQIVMFTHQSGKVWADMASIFWGAGLQVMADWYIATETTSERKKGGYVQGTHIIILRKRASNESGYKDEIVHEVRSEVANQIETMTGLNQTLKGKGRVENLFEDADLQMAGYAAALRVLTSYTKIDGTDMTREALRPRQKNERGIVDEIIEFAVQVANEHMVPEGMDPKVWERLIGAERFYLKMLDIETTGARKLDNYQNFAKAFRVADYTVMMANLDPNKARLKTGAEFNKAEFTGSEFGSSATRAVLYALYELEKDTDGDEVLAHLSDLVTGYHGKREDLARIAAYIALKRLVSAPEEASAGRVLTALIQNQRLG